MPNRSPRERLQKLFHRHDSSAKQKDAHILAPPVSPGSQAAAGAVPNSNSRASLRNVLHSRGRSLDKARDHRTSNAEDNVLSSITHMAATAAAARAMRNDQDLRLPNVVHPTDLSADLQYLTLSDEAGKLPHSEDVAERNLDRRKSREPEVQRQGHGDSDGVSALDIRPDRQTIISSNAAATNTKFPSNVKPLIPEVQRHSEDAANRNIVRNEQPLVGALHDLPPPLKIKKRTSMERRDRPMRSPISPVSTHSLNRKTNIADLRRTQPSRSVSPIVSTRAPKRSSDVERKHVKRSSLDKPLPARPSNDNRTELEGGTARPMNANATGQLADKDIDLTGVVDLTNTEDTTLHERWAPAVTHQVVTKNVHEIRREEITREIHNHHVFHRTLPIIDIEVLPARHFVPAEQGYIEIAENEIPGRTGSNAQWLIAETVSKMLPESQDSIIPTRFTARKFEGTDGDYKEYVTPEGVKRTEQWWVHSPTFYEPLAKETGQTYPFYIGSSNPAENGLTAKIPEGKVVGMSPLLAKKRREQALVQVPETRADADGLAPPVPPHKVFPAELVDRVRSQPVQRI